MNLKYTDLPSMGLIVAMMMVMGCGNAFKFVKECAY